MERLLEKRRRYKYINDQFKLIEHDNDIYLQNLSGGKSVKHIHQHIEVLRKKHYKTLNNILDGDAPKDFIQVYEYEKGSRKSKQNWAKHIAKVGHKWYPLESISEYLLNQIGQVLGLNMAKSQLRLVDNQIRFLSKYFLQEDENLVHGAQIYSAYLLESDTRFIDEIEANNLTRTLLSFQVTHDALKSVFPNQYEDIMKDLVKLLVFDAITGNNDRHFYNWGVITDLEGKKTPAFSPIYDSARGLFWNLPEDVLERKFYLNSSKYIKINYSNLERYIKASRPKIGWEGWSGETEINHFELIEKIFQAYPVHQEVCNSLLNSIHLQSVLTLLEERFKVFFTDRRYMLIRECLINRFEYLRNICKN